MLHFRLRWLTASLVWAGLCCSVYAVDGVVLIDQNRALAGGVTAGDTPGFPITISQSGSYRLTGNLTVPNASTNGIMITADNVTVDLNGFSIIGPTICSGNPVTSCAPLGTGIGVVAASPSQNISVVNGTVRGMGAAGVTLVGTGMLADHLHVSSTGSIGIVVSTGIVKDSTSNRNGTTGIIAGPGAVITGNSAVQNGSGVGINATCPSSVVNNVADSNAGTNLLIAGAGCANANNAAP